MERGDTTGRGGRFEVELKSVLGQAPSEYRNERSWSTVSEEEENEKEL